MGERKRVERFEDLIGSVERVIMRVSQNSALPLEMWLRHSSGLMWRWVIRPVANKHDRKDLALKSSFVPPGGRTGLIARPHMNRAGFATVSDEPRHKSQRAAGQSRTVRLIFSQLL